ncbi:MAG TPA: efflux RND transporter permease subunit, partial [Acetobacteraceae bacterium]|nr:efflux RND transporter permease subunit [Acetobacteraceae bacterium]
ALLNDERAVVVDVVKTQGANTIDVVRGVRRALADMQGSLPPDVRLEVVRDSSRGIQNSVNNVQETMIEGGFLTIAIVFLFLHSWRSTVITGLALPISVFGAFMVMAAFGFTLNVLTLMALSLAIGILIDDAIVVRENIMRHIGFGKSHRQAAIDGTNEIGLAVLATTFCIVAVFLPVAFMGGIIGRFFFQFGVMVSAAVLISLFVSFTLDPMLSSVWYDPQAHGNGRFARAVNATQDWIAGIYRHVLGWALRWRKTTLLLALTALIGSFFLVKFIGFEFVPQADLGEQVVSIETPVGSSLEYTDAKLRQVDAAVREFPEVDYTYGVVNTGYANGKNLASLYLRYKPLKQRQRSPAQLAQPIRDRLASIPGILVSINIPGGPGGGVQKELQLSLQGRDMEALDRISQDVMRRARSIPGLVDLDRNLKPAKPMLSVRLRRDAASDLGLGTFAVAQSLRPLFAGDETSLWRAPDGENYTVMVRLPADERTGVADLQRIWLTAGTEASGLPRMVHIAQVADIVTDTGASQINWRDLNREVQITANTSRRSSGEVSADLQ